MLRKHVLFEESSKLKRVDQKAKKALAKAAAEGVAPVLEAPKKAAAEAAPAKKAKAPAAAKKA